MPPTIRGFLLFPRDDPPSSAVSAEAAELWGEVQRWLQAATGARFLFDPDVHVLVASWSLQEVRALTALQDQQGRPDLLYDAVLGELAQLGWVAAPHIGDAWLVLVRGAGGFALGTLHDPGIVNWGILGDWALTAWMADMALMANECPPNALGAGCCDAVSQFGAILHEIGHAAFGLDHATSPESIMGYPGWCEIQDQDGFGPSLLAPEVAAANASPYWIGTGARTILPLSEAPAGVPVAAFVADRPVGRVPLTVQFQDRSTGDVTAWEWGFGDGATSTAQHPTHTYQEPGSYTVTLTVTGPGGATQTTMTITATVAADIRVPALALVGAGIALAMAATRRPQ